MYLNLIGRKRLQPRQRVLHVARVGAPFNAVGARVVELPVHDSVQSDVPIGRIRAVPREGDGGAGGPNLLQVGRCRRYCWSQKTDR